jgi:hypothetical protein
LGSLHDILQKAIIIIRVLKFGGFRLLQGTVTYLHPLLGPAHRLKVAGYSRWVDKVLCEKFEPIATSRCGLGHQCRTDRLRVLISDERTTTSKLVSGSASPRTSFVIPGAAVSAGSVAAPVTTSASGTTPSTGTASGMVLPSTCVPVNTRHTVSVPGGHNYYLRWAASAQSTYLLLHWLQAAQSLCPEPQFRSVGGEQTPLQHAWEFLQPLPCWDHLLPRINQSTSCTVQNWWSTK